jgi:hypothetical protein
MDLFLGLSVFEAPFLRILIRKRWGFAATRIDLKFAE